MLNCTFIALSLSSLYSFSPLITGNSNLFHDAFFQKYYFSNFFLNPTTLQLDKSIFLKGLGSILYISDSSSLYEHHNLLFTSDNYSQIQLPTDSKKYLITFQNCVFNSLKDIDSHIIDIFNDQIMYTFFMMNCIISSCYFKHTPIRIKVRATTISNICVSDLTGFLEDPYSEDYRTSLLLAANWADDSFFKFTYSTIYGNTNDKLNNNRLNCKNIIYSLGRCSMLYQYLNISRFYTHYNYDSEDESILNIKSNKCLNFVMNTFEDTDSPIVLSLNPQNGDQQTKDFPHYIGECNFVNNIFYKYVFYIDMNSNTNMMIDGCSFITEKVVENGKLTITIKKNSDMTELVIRNCVFNRDLEVDEHNLRGCKIENCAFSNPELNSIKFDNICNQFFDIDINALPNITEAMGCPANSFEFKSDDVGYETPLPTNLFTESADFTSSFYFTNSNKFTNSEKFTFSDKFTSSKKFTFSDEFTNTEKFSKTDQFTSSKAFSCSNKFTPSDDFDVTRHFTSSHNFTSSDEFTKSNNFNPTEKFTKSNNFNPTEKFTKSNDFSSSNSFSKSGSFTSSSHFNESKEFTSSIQFSSSELFYINKNIDSSNKSNKAVVIGAAVGAVAAAIIIAALIAFFIIRKRRLIPTSDFDLMNETNSSITVDNALQTVMNEDDPFAADFNNELH